MNHGRQPSHGAADDAEPTEGITEPRIDGRPARPEWRDRRKTRDLCTPARRDVDDPTVAVAHGEQPVAGSSDDGETALDPAQDGHAGVRPGIPVEIPPGHEKRIHPEGGVAAPERREV